MNAMRLQFSSLLSLCLLFIVSIGAMSRADAQTLTSEQPVDGAVDVPLSANIVFGFDVSLFPITFGAVTWSSNVDPNKMSYAWSVNNTVLTCNYSGNLPGLSSITWEINPEGAAFLFDADTFTPVEYASGSFTTVGGDDCNPDGVPDSYGRLLLFKVLSYSQTSASTPVLSAENPATFSALVDTPADNAVTAASLKLPNGSVSNLLSLGGEFILGGGFDSQAELDAAFPTGSYEMTMTRATPPATKVTMTVPSGYPTTPQVANYAAAQTVDPTVDFTLQWGAFAGATGSDLLILEIADGGNTILVAPDSCVPIDLPNNATSFVIPAGTLEEGKIYDGAITFYKTFFYNTNSPADFLSAGAMVKTTQFTINTGGTVSTPPPVLSSPAFNLGGKFAFTAGDLQVGTQYRLEYSTTLLPNFWTLLELLTPTAAVEPIVDNSSNEAAGQRFYRVIKQ
jgi:hypothetical protein